MSRYVDIERLVPMQVENSEVELGILVYDYDAVQHEPFIDIVRCRECKWLRYCETEEMELTLDCDHPDGGGIPRSEEWFCADGERKGQV
jgi:hypothetical protein